jgi:hypothetical protein
MNLYEREEHTRISKRNPTILPQGASRVSVDDFLAHDRKSL